MSSPKPTKQPKRSKPVASPAPVPELPSDDMASALDALNDTNLDDLLGAGGIEGQLAKLNQKSPLDDLQPTGSLEEDCKQEASATLKAFKEAARNEQKQFMDNTDSEYWFCVCFQSREQKDEFLKTVGWQVHGDKYLDGVWVAKKLGIALPAASVRFIKEDKDKRLTSELPVIGGNVPPKVTSKPKAKGR